QGRFRERLGDSAPGDRGLVQRRWRHAESPGDDLDTAGLGVPLALKIAVERQNDIITDETRARVAMVRPIIRATLFALQAQRVNRLGGYAAITLADVAREYREGDGDCGVCFEYAVHDAIERRDPLIQPRIT